MFNSWCRRAGLCAGGRPGWQPCRVVRRCDCCPALCSCGLAAHGLGLRACHIHCSGGLSRALAAALDNYDAQVLPLGAYNITLPMLSDQLSWQHRPSRARYDSVLLPWPACICAVYRPGNPERPAPLGYLIGDDCPSFPSYEAAFRAFFYGDYSRSSAGSLPSGFGDVRVVEGTAWFERVVVTPTSLEVRIGGRNIIGARVELNGATYRTDARVSETGQVQLPLPDGLPARCSLPPAGPGSRCRPADIDPGGPGPAGPAHLDPPVGPGTQVSPAGSVRGLFGRQQQAERGACASCVRDGDPLGLAPWIAVSPPIRTADRRGRLTFARASCRHRCASHATERSCSVHAAACYRRDSGHEGRVLPADLSLLITSFQSFR